MGEYITTFRGKYAFLSNFYSCVIRYNGATYNSVECAFQAQKCPSMIDMFRNMGTQEAASHSRKPIIEPGEAKRLGRKVYIRQDWEDIKERIMLELLVAKFDQNADLKHQLLETGMATLIEGNTWHDNYWGVCQCPNCVLKVHRNRLGVLLTEIRDTYAHDKRPLEVIEVG